MVNYPVILFTSVGAVAGLATAIWALHELSIKTVAAGVLFALALAIAMALTKKHLTRGTTRLKLSAFLAVVATSYPIAVLVMLAANVLSRQLNSDPQFNFLSGLLVGVITAATLMQLALMVLGERWSTGQWVVFLGTGMFASLLAFCGGCSLCQKSEHRSRSSILVRPFSSRPGHVRGDFRLHADASS